MLRGVFLVFALLVVTVALNSDDHRTRHKQKFTIDELLTTVFPKKTSDDLDLDPCKAGKIHY